MRHDEQTDFRAVLSTALNVYERRLDPAQAAMWFDALGDLSLDQVREGLRQHLRDPAHGQFPPKPADILRAITVSQDSLAMRAWDSLVRAIRRGGHTHDVVLPDAVAHAVVRDFGGWLAVCRWTEEELPYRQRDFSARYLGYRGQAPSDYPPILMGFGTYDQRPPPMLCGPREECERVMQGALRLEQDRRVDAIAAFLDAP